MLTRVTLLMARTGWSTRNESGHRHEIPNETPVSPAEARVRAGHAELLRETRQEPPIAHIPPGYLADSLNRATAQVNGIYA
jgi:hypothetical protein